MLNLKIQIYKESKKTFPKIKMKTEKFETKLNFG